MENFLLYCYKEWLKEKDGNIFKQISKLTVGAIILLSLLLVTLIAFFVILGRSLEGKNNSGATLILSVVYVILCITTSIYCEKYQVKHSKQGLENYKKDCNDMMKKVLSKYGFTGSFIPTLIDRFNAMINRIDEKIKTKHEHFNKFFEMLLIPISVIILGALLDKGTDSTDTLGLGLSGLLIILMIYAVAFFILFVYDFVMRLPQGKYKEFVTDLQSILDFKECKDASELDDDTSISSSTENTSESTIVNISNTSPERIH